MGEFKRSSVHSEGILHKKKYHSARLCTSCSVRYYALVSARKIVTEA